MHKILLDSTHFQDIRDTICTKPVAWEALVRTADLNDTDADVARQLFSSLIKRNGVVGEGNLPVAKSVASLTNLLSTCMNQDAKKAVVNLLAEMLTQERYMHETVQFFKENKGALEELYNATLGSAKIDDHFLLVSTFVIVTLLVQEGLNSDRLVHKLLSNEAFLSALRNLSQMDTCCVFIRLLQELISVKRFRFVMWKHEVKIMPILFEFINQALKSKTSNRMSTNNSNNLRIQSQYYALLIIWLVTFDRTIASEFAKKYLAELLKLLKLVKITIKEKITRLSIAILINCVTREVKGCKTIIKNILLLGSGLSIIQQLRERKYSDEELREDLAQLSSILESEYQELTSFDEYVAEVDSKLLIWSPPHIDNSFWSDNSIRFKEGNWKLFKQLLMILSDFSTSFDSKHYTALQVALNDITHIVELQPECVNILGELNAKVIIMELLNHPDSKVKYEALKTTQAFVANAFK